MIRKTNSSKGALFHHFKTLDDLFLESLRHFSGILEYNFSEKNITNLNDFVRIFAKDVAARQSNKGYFHIVHFYRDRALKDVRFKDALNALYDSYIDIVIEELKPLAPPAADFNRARGILNFFYFGIEGLSYRKVILDSSDEFDGFIEPLKAIVLAKLESVCKP